MDEGRSVHISVCGFSDVGPKRADNQDVIMANGAIGVGSHSWISLEGDLDGAFSAAVVDGMGGYVGGADAAAIAAAFLGSRHLPDNAEDANSLFERLDVGISAAGAAWATPKMGATAAMLTLRAGSAFFANVGDCRIYRVVDGGVQVMTVDDRFRNSNHIVTQSLGQVRRLNAHFRKEPLGAGRTRFALCSDGTWGTLKDCVMNEFLTSDESLHDLLASMRSALFEHRANDNVSVLLIDVDA